MQTDSDAVIKLGKHKLTQWSNEPTVSDLKNDYTSAKSQRDKHVAEVDDWLDQLNVEGIYKATSRKGRSKVQPKLIRKQAEWRYSALSEPFLSTDELFSLSPKTYADREAAYQNQLILNYQMNNQLDKVHLIDTYVRTAVNQGTVIARCGWNYETRIEKQEQPVYSYEEVSDPQEAQMLLQAGQLSDDEISQLPPDMQESVAASIENGRPIHAVDTGTTETVEVEVTTRNQPEICICDYKSITPDPTCGNDFSKASFVVYEFDSSLSDLEKSSVAYKNLDAIQPDTTDEVEESGFQFQDKPRQKFVVYEYWGYWDIDGSGITTPIVASWVGSTMIRMEVNPYPDQELPFVVIPYLPTDTIYGEPDAVLIEDNQKLVGAITRGMIDALARSANGQNLTPKGFFDVPNKRKFEAGLDCEYNPQAAQGQLATLTYPELPQSAYNMLNMFNMEAEAITGIKSFTGGLSGNALGDTATGVRGLLDAASKRELNILRRLAGGLEKLARKVMAMNGEWLSDEEVIRVTDEDFVAINRDNLAGTYDIKLSISNADSDNIKAQELAFMLQTMGQSLPFDMTKIILSEIAKLRNMPDLAKLIQKYEPQPDPKQELEVQKLQLENQLAQTQIQKELAEVQLKQAQIQKELAMAKKYGSESNKKDLDFIEQESGVTQERQKELQQAQAEGNTRRDILKTLLDTKLKGNVNDNRTSA